MIPEQAVERYVKWLGEQMQAQRFPGPQEVFAFGYQLGREEPCPECAEREQLQFEAEEGLRTAMEIAFEGR